MKNSCSGQCEDCLYSYNPVVCLAPQFGHDSFTPITESGLKKVLRSIELRLVLGSSMYENRYGQNLKYIDYKAWQRIKRKFSSDFSR